MNVYLNEQSVFLDASCTLEEMLVKNNAFAQHMAVAINSRLIPKSMFATTVLKEGDRIDLIVPMQGG